MKKLSYYENAIAIKSERTHSKHLRMVSDFYTTDKYQQLHFNSYDFLGLSTHPHIKKTVIKYVLEWGVGTIQSRFHADHIKHHRKIESNLADLTGKEEALLLPNSTLSLNLIFSALITPKMYVFVDRCCSPKIMKILIATKAKIVKYEHNNFTHLTRLLQKTEKNVAKWIVTESLFNISGNLLDVHALQEIALEFGALTFVDDSNTVGMMGKYGMGHVSCRADIDVIFGSLGKQLGSLGSFMGCCETIKTYLLTHSVELADSSLVPPSILGAIKASIDLIPDMRQERENILEIADLMRNSLKDHHFDIPSGQTHFIPIVFRTYDDYEKALQELLSQSIIICTQQAPHNSIEEFSICAIVNANHKKDDIENIVGALVSAQSKMTRCKVY